MSNMIEFNSVRYAYKSSEGEDEQEVINNINLSVKQGEFLAVLGHNGSGKSTLAKHINAMLIPTEGTVIVDGINTKNPESLWDVRSTAGMVFQNPDNQIVATIVEEDVAFGPENLGVEPSEIRKIVDDSLKKVDMYEYRKHAPHLLSGGQKQRVAIAGVLAMKPKCIVFDEPTAMLDPKGRKEVMEQINELNSKYGITIVLITHYMDEAAQADRIVIIDDGKLVMEGTPRKIFSNVEKVKSLGLDVPQVTELAYELSKEGIHLKTDVLNVDEMVEALCQLK